MSLTTLLANHYVQLTFCSWLDPLFYLGVRQELQQEDLYAHPLEADSEHLLARFNW